MLKDLYSQEIQEKNALLALGAGTLRVSREGAVSNEKTWRQRKGREHAGSTGLIPTPAPSQAHL